jgi:ferric-dicitrate binding protein FerR (iron transport regulator)
MLNERFIELLTKHLSSEINEEEFREFRQLLAADELNRQQYELFKDFWEQKDQHYHDSELLFNKIKSRIGVDVKPETIIEFPVVKRRSMMWTGIAAAILIVFCCLALYKWETQSNQLAGEDFAGLDSTITKPQARSIITLTDGTHVTLNSESTLKYPPSFSGKTREVYLVGEAFFDVHKDSQHPFIIHSGKMNIKVLGTAFNVKAYPMDFTSETTLIRGMIEVTLNDRPLDRIILKPKEKLILKNNQVFSGKPLQYKTRMSDSNNKINQYTLTTLTYFKSQDTSVVETSWLKNKLIFRNEDFATLAERMQRWYGVNIIFNNEEVKLYHFNGIFETETIDQALDALRITEKFHYKIDKSTVFIY